MNDITVLVHPHNDMASKPAGSRDDSPVDPDCDPTIAFRFQYPSQPSSIRPFHIVFIPDPNLELKNKSAAMNDLAFIHTHLSESEHASMQHLEGSVHSITVVSKIPGSGRGPPKYKVCMQEWVSFVSFSQNFPPESSRSIRIFPAVSNDDAESLG